jgi:hypothetical protein
MLLGSSLRSHLYRIFSGKSALSNPLLALLLIALYAVSLSIFSRNTPHFPFGDGPEYIIMTESFYQHCSPEVRRSDVESYVAYLDSHNLEVFSTDIFLLPLSQPKDGPFNFPAYFPAHDGSRFAYHFWMYSLINVPARAVLGYFDADIRITFLATNLFLLFLGIAVIVFLKELNPGHKVVLSLFLILSPSLWYIDWAHTEVYAGVLTFLGVLLFHVRKKYASLLCFSLASMHFPPLFIPALFVFIYILYRDGFKFKVLFKLFLSSFWIIVPPLFYLYHFSVPNLIADTTLLSKDEVNLTRLFSFFFDLNQGMIIGIPLVLLLMIGFLFRDLIKRKFYLEYIFLICILLMSLFFMQMTNWNHGNAVVNRYVVWTASIVFAVFYIRIKEFKQLWFYVLSGLVIVSQGVVIFSQQEFIKIEWHANSFNKLSKAVMNHYPSLYNPDPHVFKERAGLYALSATDSVYVYTNADYQILKMLVRKGAITQLIERGVDSSSVFALEEKLNYYHGYAYINKPMLDKIGYDQSKDNYINYIEQEKESVLKANLRQHILNNPGWYRKIETYAIEKSIPLDSAIQLNVNYMYNHNRQAN